LEEKRISNVDVDKQPAVKVEQVADDDRKLKAENGKLK